MFSNKNIELTEIIEVKNAWPTIADARYPHVKSLATQWVNHVAWHRHKNNYPLATWAQSTATK